MYISQQNPENEFDAVNTELVVGVLEQTIKPLSTVSPFPPDPPRTQATGVWNLDSFTVAFLSFPTREGAIRPLRKRKVKCYVRREGWKWNGKLDCLNSARSPANLAVLVVRVDDDAATLETVCGFTALHWMLLKAGLDSPSCC